MTPTNSEKKSGNLCLCLHETIPTIIEIDGKIVELFSSGKTKAKVIVRSSTKDIKIKNYNRVKQEQLSESTEV
jgi:hypothetical protein